MRFRKMLEALNANWICKSIFIFLPTAYSIFLATPYAKSRHLINSNGEWTILAIVVLVVVCGLGLLGTLASNCGLSTLKRLTNNLMILEHVIQAKSAILHNQYSNLLDYVNKRSNADTTTPKKQLEKIIEEIDRCVYMITGISQNDIVTSIAYCFNDPNNATSWKWADSSRLKCSKYTLEELISNEKSTFYQVYSGETDYAFYNSKKEAEGNGHYLRDQNDGDNDGSILCREIPVSTEGKNKIKVILSISTNGEKFSPQGENIKNVKNTLGNVILASFEENIRIQILNWYIEEMHKKAIKDADEEEI